MENEAAESRDELETFLTDVRELMVESLGDTPIGQLVNGSKGMVGSGKLLRSRMAFRLLKASPASRISLVHAAAAVEMIHAASLLHDDVIDGGIVRRSAPTFWVKSGIPGAILLGDLLLFKALDITCQVEGGRLTHTLVKMTGEVCEAEAEQELILRGTRSTWENCVRIARCKTGALFAFIGHACGGDDAALQAALQEAGYSIGTAYQISDDLLDVNGSEEDAGKTLGTDEARNKTTAANLGPAEFGDPVAFIEDLTTQATSSLSAWPRIQEAWSFFVETDIQPTLDKHIKILANI